MTSVIKALYNFFSSFGVHAYQQDSVPDGAELPYITVELMDPGVGEAASFTASVWDRSGSLEGVSAIVDDIKAAIGPGAVIPTEDGGTVWIYQETPFSQVMPYIGDPNYRRVYLRMRMQALTK